MIDYLQAELNLAIVHDWDIASMAVTAAGEFGLADFSASNGWITKFKATHNLGSRKITKYVTENHREKEADLFLTAAEFVHDVKEVIRRFGPQRVYNSDQSGFEYEFHSGRTIRRKGTTFLCSFVIERFG